MLANCIRHTEISFSKCCLPMGTRTTRWWSHSAPGSVDISERALEREGGVTRCRTHYHIPCFNIVPPSRAGVSQPLLVGQIQPVPPVFINKLLLGYSHTHLFTYCLQLLSHYSSKVEYYNRNHLANRTWNIYSLSLYGKSSLIHARATLSGIKYASSRSLCIKHSSMAKFFNYSEPNPLIFNIRIVIILHNVEY